mmetsp:Transcript_68/g.122  ORF Transcript_68/g.122 Transcript_68/m.122 type:complete len:629 (+) Transcript_68:28-1914(+)
MARRKEKKAKPQPQTPPSSSSEEEVSASELDKSMDAEEESVETENQNSSSEDEGNVTFTDENSKWLKPVKKSQLLSDDSADEESEEGENSDESEGDDESLMQVERDAMELDMEANLEREEAENELQRTVRDQSSTFHLPTVEELEGDGMERVVPPSEIRARIEDIIEVLADFKQRREEGRSRSEYLERLKYDMSEFFGCLPELIELFLNMFNPTECLEFLDASDMPRPLVIRTNTLKVRRKDLAQALMKRGINLDPLAKWSKVGLKISESPVPVGATPEYLAGYYMLQSAASMCPVMALSPQPGEKVMDMASAPGGKTSYLAQMMKNTGHILANDLKKERQKATIANLHRLGVKNTVVCCHDGRKLAKMVNRFDRILLDAPCSGLGVISRDQSVKVQRTIKDIERTAHLQKELLLAGIDALNHKSKTGGFIVYSTCSVSVAENEEVVNYILSKRDVKIVDAGLDFGVPGYTRYQHKRFHPSVALTRRFYPHVHNMDGFYVAKIQKLSDWRPGQDKGKANTEEKIVEEVVEIVNMKEIEKELGLGKKQMKQKESKTAVSSDNDVEVAKSKDVDDQDNKRFNKRDANKKGAKRAMGIKKKLSDKYAKKAPVPKKKKKTNAKVTKPRRHKI